MCYFLDNRRGERPGQIAHIDSDASNAAPSNLVWLCLEHHDRYDSSTSQSKGLTPEEVRAYRERLEQELGRGPTADGSPEPPPDFELLVRVSACQGCPCLQLQFNLENAGSRPIRVVSWWWATVTGAAQEVVDTATCQSVLLRERDTFSFVGRIDGHAPADVKRLAIRDSDGRDWPVDEVQLDAIRRLPDPRELFGHLVHDDLGELPDTPDSHCLSASIDLVNHAGVEAIRIVLHNRGENEIPIAAARLVWSLKSPRGRPAPGVHARLVGGELNIPLPSPLHMLAPGSDVSLKIPLQQGGLIVDAAASDVDVDSIALELKASKTGALRVSGSELATAVHGLARMWFARSRER